MSDKDLFILKKRTQRTILVIIIFLVFLIYIGVTSDDIYAHIVAAGLVFVSIYMICILSSLYRAKWPMDFNGRKLIVTKGVTKLITHSGYQILEKGTICYLISEDKPRNGLVYIETEKHVIGYAAVSKFVR